MVGSSRRAIGVSSGAGSVNGTGADVCTAITMKRLPLPSADTAAMFPCKPGGVSSGTTELAQSGGSNFSPGGSLCADSTLGSMAVFEVSLTLYSGPKADFTWEIFAISAVGAVSDAP